MYIMLFMDQIYNDNMVVLTKCIEIYDCKVDYKKECV